MLELYLHNITATGGFQPFFSSGQDHAQRVLSLQNCLLNCEGLDDTQKLGPGQGGAAWLTKKTKGKQWLGISGS